MHQLCVEYNDVEFIDPAVYLVHLHTRSKRGLLISNLNENLHYIFIPINETGAHWILVVIDVVNCNLMVLDPMANTPNGIVEEKLFKLAGRILEANFARCIKQIEFIRHTIQQDSCSCGVLCCYYAV